MHPSRRQFLVGLAGLSAAAVGLSACNASARTDAAPTPAAGAVEDGAFPVTIAHKHGETTLTAAPQRVVTVGLKEQDDVLALGTVPVGATKWLDFGDGGVFGPWAADLLQGKAKPQVLPDTGIAFEKIAALAPDLIIATYSALKPAEYKKLAAIAPTVAQPKEYDDWGVPWDVQALTVGKAMGQPARMQQLVDRAKAKVAEAKAAHPEFAGKVGLVATPWEGIFVYGAQDPRPRLLTDLGFTLPADLGSVTKGAFGGNLSTEKVEFLDVDALIWFVQKSPSEVTKVIKPYANLRVAKQGHDIYSKPGDVINEAFSHMTVLSLPSLLAGIVPRLAAAVDGNPATSTDA